MKQDLLDLLQQSAAALQKAGKVEAAHTFRLQLSPSKEAAQGDFASNVALMNAKPLGLPPRQLAELLVEHLPASPILNKVEIAGPGFINFFLHQEAQNSVVGEILQAGDEFAKTDLGQGESVQIEFVSANPTGPLHVGHGRGAAYGDSLARLLEATGFKVQKEYYVNDAGRQMDILGTSVWLRYLELAGEELSFPSNGYQGDYVWDIGATLHREHGDAFRHDAASVFAHVCADEADGGDKEKHIDDLIARARDLLGEADYRRVFDLGLNTLVDVIRRDLAAFGVEYDEWFSERGLMDDQQVEASVKELQEAGHVYEQNGALWFRSSDFGDEKDRVVQRDNGQYTYFASDIAYHRNKFARGFNTVINIWGADHHGYIARVKAALSALGLKADQLDIQLVQFANLFRAGEKVAMSTRSGQFVTLKTLRDDVGVDAARFFYVMRKADQHMDFDLDLAREQSSDNPVYYVQYAHARVCSVEAQMQERGLAYETETALAALQRLDQPHETAVLKHLAQFKTTLNRAASQREPHQVVNYLRELAQLFHTWYNASQFLVDDAELRQARLALAFATRVVLAAGLQLIGVSAPEKM